MKVNKVIRGALVVASGGGIGATLALNGVTVGAPSYWIVTALVAIIIFFA